MPTFQDAVNALWAPDEDPWSLFYETGNDAVGHLLRLRAITDDGANLPAYWTCSAPVWMDRTDCVDFRDRNHTDSTRTLRYPTADNTEADAFPEVNRFPIFCFEIDYLVYDEKRPETRQLQKDAILHALHMSGFPYSLLVDSGGKSIHIYVRIIDINTYPDFWQKNGLHKRIMDLAWSVFGNYDSKVTNEFGRVRLVRTPNAVREDGARQSIVAVGKPCTAQALWQWFAGQVRPMVVHEVTSRDPVIHMAVTKRRYALRTESWRYTLYNEPWVKGNRGSTWVKISKELVAAGMKPSVMHAQPTPAEPWGRFDAGFLWWVSAYVVNHLSHGWFFSQNPEDWKDRNERVRDAGFTDVEAIVEDKRAYDVSKNRDTVDALWEKAQEQNEQAKAAVAVGLPAPAGASAANTQALQAQTAAGVAILAPKGQEKKGKEEKFNPDAWTKLVIDKENLAGNLIRVHEMDGDQWYRYAGKIWKKAGRDNILKTIRAALKDSVDRGLVFKQQDIMEIYHCMEAQFQQQSAWTPNPYAIAFANGTLYLERDGGRYDPELFVFTPSHKNTDHLTWMIPFVYDEKAACPEWEKCMQRFLPADWRRRLVQEMMGYVFLPGQPFHSFFVLIGTGSNFKSTLLKVMQAMFAESNDAISLERLSGNFSLGTKTSTHLAVDADANFGSSKNFDGPAVADVVKKWTGGDCMEVEQKFKDSRSTFLQPKLVVATNNRIKFSDPSGGLWRRLVPIKFEVTITKKDDIPDFYKLLIEHEMPGIIQWALRGLARICRNNSLSLGPEVQEEVESYQA